MKWLWCKCERYFNANPSRTEPILWMDCVLPYFLPLHLLLHLQAAPFSPSAISHSIDYKWNTSSFLLLLLFFHQAPTLLPAAAAAGGEVREVIFYPLSIDFPLLHLLDELLLYLVHLAVQWKYLIVFQDRFLLNFLKKLPCAPHFLLFILDPTKQPTNQPTDRPPGHVKLSSCRANYCAMTP